MKPLAIDLFCGLGGWAEGLLAEGYEVIGFDIEQHCYGDHRYPAQLVLQDVLTLDGAQFKDAALIVASPPCQAYSYRAMPWRRAKALPPPDNTLFEACFRIKREACAAAGRQIPMVVENVRGAQPWVGRARWNYGSFYLWGDVPALMPFTHISHHKIQSSHLFLRDPARANGKFAPLRSVGVGKRDAIKNASGSWFRGSHNNVPHSRGDAIAHTPHMTNPAEHIKGMGIAHRGYGGLLDPRRIRSGTPARKAASAMIAKIPLSLARHIGAVYRQ